VGVKVGFANKAVWKLLKLDTLVWAHMYDDTVRYAVDNTAKLPMTSMYAPKIEPEIIFKLRRTIADDERDLSTEAPAAKVDPAAVLDAVEWIALGFEIIDCVFADWKFQPADFVASFGLHAALIVGEPRVLTPDVIPALVEQLPKFTVKLSKNGEVVQEGSGRNVLRSPALCLSELASAMARHGTPLSAGDVISSGTMTESQLIAPGQTWTAVLDGLDLPALTVRTE
jgi:2-oxo-3-hexenedioate decarboxylase